MHRIGSTAVPRCSPSVASESAAVAAGDTAGGSVPVSGMDAPFDASLEETRFEDLRRDRATESAPAFGDHALRPEPEEHRDQEADADPLRRTDQVRVGDVRKELGPLQEDTLDQERPERASPEISPAAHDHRG